MVWILLGTITRITHYQTHDIISDLPTAKHGNVYAASYINHKILKTWFYLLVILEYFKGVEMLNFKLNTHQTFVSPGSRGYCNQCLYFLNYQ